MHLLVDGQNLLWRSALGKGTTDRRDSRGKPVGAALVFMQTLLSACERHNPTHGAVVFDGPEISFRAHLLPTYKGNREHGAIDFALEQIPLMKRAARALGLVVIQSGIYEADDVIATLATQARRAIILSDDKDLGALVSKWVMQQRHCDAKEGKPAPLIDEQTVVVRWGVIPKLVADLQALAGDRGDGVCGIDGVGPAAARKMLGSKLVEYAALNACGKQHWMHRASAMVEIARMSALTRLLTDAPFGNLPPRAINWPSAVHDFFMEIGADRIAKNFAIKHRSSSTLFSH